MIIPIAWLRLNFFMIFVFRKKGLTSLIKMNYHHRKDLTNVCTVKQVTPSFFPLSSSFRSLYKIKGDLKITLLTAIIVLMINKYYKYITNTLLIHYFDIICVCEIIVDNVDRHHLCKCDRAAV